MNKKSILFILLDLVFLVVFNTIFFAGGGIDRPASVWISYAFIHFAYLMILATPFLVGKGSSAAVFGFSLYSISAVYFFLEFVVGLVFIIIGSESYKAALVAQIVIAGLYAVILIANLIANEYTAESVERREDETAYIKEAASRIKILIGKADDKKANKEIERAYDILHSSPSRSDATVKQLETEIKNKVTELEDAVASKETELIITVAGELAAVTEERNRKLKLNN